MVILEGSERFVAFSDLGCHRENHIIVVTVQALIHSHKNPAIAVFYSTRLNGRGKSILSCLQMEHNSAAINDKTIKLQEGKQ
jgi:hypothetical protein